MRTNSHETPATDRVALIGTGAAALTTLWNLAAAGAHVRWYVDRADIGTETVLASSLASRFGRGRIELTFGDPRAAPFDGTTAVVAAQGGDLDRHLAERAHADGVPVHVVGRPDLSTIAFEQIGKPRRSGWDGSTAAPQAA